MGERTVTVTDLKQNLSDLINRAAYGGERIILLSRGKPRAALIGIEDLERLQILEQESSLTESVQQQLTLLEKMDALRVQMQLTGQQTNSTETLNHIREERLSELMDLS
jgi:prevent-host-death family protein